MAFSGTAGCMTYIDDMQLVLLAFPATVEQQHVGFGSDPTAGGPLFPTQPVAAAVAAEGGEEPSFIRRRISNRESARRSRARKQRHLEELRDSAALLQRGNRDLAARVEAARGRLALALLTNAALRAEDAALSRRLAAARRALVLGRRRLMYAGAGADIAISADDDNSDGRLGSTDIEQMIASLIAEPPYELHLHAAAETKEGGQQSTLMMIN